MTVNRPIKTNKLDTPCPHPKETGVATVEGRPHEAVYMCFEKNYAEFLLAPFMGSPGEVK